MLFEPAVSHSTNSSNPRVSSAECDGRTDLRTGRDPLPFATELTAPARAITSAATHRPELSLWHPTCFSLWRAPGVPKRAYCRGCHHETHEEEDAQPT